MGYLTGIAAKLCIAASYTLNGRPGQTFDTFSF